MNENITQCIQQWTREDFTTEKPYEWLYKQKNDEFLFYTLFERLKDHSKEVGFTGFAKFWKAYVERNTRQVTGIYETAFPDQPLQLQAGQYICDEYGVKRLGTFGQEIIVIEHPLMITGRSVDITSGNHFFDVAFFRESEGWKTLRNIPQETLSNSQKIIGLSSRGPTITSDNAKEVVRYIATLINLNYNGFSCGKITSRLGWTDDGKLFIPYDRDVIYDENGSFQREFQAVRCEGDFGVWKETVSSLRKPSPINTAERVYIAASFASVLASKLGALPCIIHLIGPSGCGKTVSMLVSASVWAEPKEWIQSLSATMTANETLAGFVHDLPLMLDELQTVAESRNGRNNLQNLIYNLAEGTGKGRGTKDGGLRKRHRWNCFTFTTGEQSLTDDRSHEGALQRVIELRVKKGFLKNPAEVANIVKENYGWAGRKFLDYILSLDDEQWRQIKKRYSDLTNEIQSKGIANKQAASAAVILVADQLADAAVFNDGFVLTTEDILPCLKNTDEIDINLRCYEYILSWLDENESRFTVSRSDYLPTVTYGKIISYDDEIPNHYHIYPKVLDDILREAGFDHSSFIEWAVEKEVLHTTEKERKKRKDGTTIRNQQRVYDFYRRNIDPEPDQPDEQI